MSRSKLYLEKKHDNDEQWFLMWIGSLGSSRTLLSLKYRSWPFNRAISFFFFLSYSSSPFDYSEIQFYAIKKNKKCFTKIT